MKKVRIPGVTFSWKRALGIDQMKRKIACETGIPTTRAGLERKIGNTILKSIQQINKTIIDFNSKTTKILYILTK